MTKEALNEFFTVLKMIDIKLTNQEKAVARYLLQARATRREKAVEKITNTKKSTTTKKEAKANAN